MQQQNNVTSDERNLAIVCHLSGLINFIFLAGIVIPLLVWLVKKDQSEFLNKQGIEVLNFQISMVIYFGAASILLFLLIGFFILPALGVFYIVMMILGAIKASNGEHFKYPLAIPFIQ